MTARKNTRKRTAKPRRDIHQEVTNRILEQLEQGVAPWTQTWGSGGFQAANGIAADHNAQSKRPYRGVNTLLLWIRRYEAGFRSNGWLTFKQAKELGGNVRKGEKGTQVVFYNFKDVTETGPDGTERESRVAWTKFYTVFNLDQCEGLPERYRVQPVAPIQNPDGRRDDCEAFIKHTGASFTEDGSRAPCYRPLSDSVHMPRFANFETAGDYYAAAFHELTHWTGHATRCDRELSTRFGDDAYAAEELIAELGAAFLCAEHALPGQLQHASYLDHWIKVLKADKRAIFTAASKAQQAADYLNGLQPKAATNEQAA